MKLSLVQIVAKMLRDAANKLDAGNSELSETEAMDIMAALSHHVMSKDTACRHLNISRSHFDDLVRAKRIPKGRKRVGFKELVWYQDELDEYIRIINNK
jgi:predicted DNA-binding transcriptional regulator AlpA